MTRPLVLLSNDDGYDAPGIVHARAALAEWADVITVAPETEQSATSHALSLARPLRPRKVEPGVFAIDGTPADCVYVALHAGQRFLPRRPDIVVSGINRGLNLGQDVFYSGTVAAAREGALRDLPALAASAHVRADLAKVAALVVRIAERLLAARRAGPGRAPLLNLNVPEVWNGDVRVARTGSRLYEELVEFRDDPRGREYLWLGGPGVTHAHDPGADTEAYDAGAASLTPLALDLTNEAQRPLCDAIVAGLPSTAEDPR